MKRKYKTVVNSINYAHDFDKDMAKAVSKIEECGGKVLDLKPFAGSSHVLCLITYEEKKAAPAAPAAKPAASKPKSAAAKPAR